MKGLSSFSLFSLGPRFSLYSSPFEEFGSILLLLLSSESRIRAALCFVRVPLAAVDGRFLSGCCVTLQLIVC